MTFNFPNQIFSVEVTYGLVLYIYNLVNNKPMHAQNRKLSFY